MRPLARPSAKARIWRKFLRQREGNAAIIFALSLIVILMAAGGAVDYARAYNARRALQASIDSSVLAGAGAGYSATTAQAVFDAQHDSLRHISFEGTVGVPVYGTAADGSFTGTFTAQVTTYFLKLIGMPSLTVTASAAAGTLAVGNDVCILLVDSSASYSLKVNSVQKVYSSDCEIDVASTANSAAYFDYTPAVKKICVAGTTGGNNINKAIATDHCTVATDPFAGKLPVPDTTCTITHPVTIANTQTMPPGVYCADVTFRSSANVTFQGLYVIKNGSTWDFEGAHSYTGTGATFYFADAGSNFRFNGTNVMTLAAPTSGLYSGILMYEPNGLSQSYWKINLADGHSLSGLIYLPSKNITLDIGTSTTPDKVTMVFNTLQIEAANWSFTGSAKSITGGASGTAGGIVYLKK